MIKFRHLIWTVVANDRPDAFGIAKLLRSRTIQATSQGLSPTTSVELDPEFRAHDGAVPHGRRRRGTIIIQTSERHLYVVQGNGRAIRYGHRPSARDGLSVAGPADNFAQGGMAGLDNRPPEMIARQPYLPRFMAGGPRQPARRPRTLPSALTVYRIHGNQPSGYDRHRRLVRLLPAGQRRRHRPL